MKYVVMGCLLIVACEQKDPPRAPVPAAPSASSGSALTPVAQAKALQPASAPSASSAPSSQPVTFRLITVDRSGPDAFAKLKERLTMIRFPDAVPLRDGSSESLIVGRCTLDEAFAIVPLLDAMDFVRSLPDRPDVAMAGCPALAEGWKVELLNREHKLAVMKRENTDEWLVVNPVERLVGQGKLLAVNERGYSVGLLACRDGVPTLTWYERDHIRSGVATPFLTSCDPRPYVLALAEGTTWQKVLRRPDYKGPSSGSAICSPAEVAISGPFFAAVSDVQMTRAAPGDAKAIAASQPVAACPSLDRYGRALSLSTPFGTLMLASYVRENASCDAHDASWILAALLVAPDGAILDRWLLDSPGESAPEPEATVVEGAIHVQATYFPRACSQSDDWAKKPSRQLQLTFVARDGKIAVKEKKKAGGKLDCEELCGD